MRLRDMREDRDLTQTQIAALLHVRQSTYSQYENGQRQIPIDFLMSLADFFDTSVDYILERTNVSIPYPKSKNLE